MNEAFSESGERETILVVRLGALGDIIHALPAVASLKASFPHRKLVWVVKPRWLPILAGNPQVDQLLPLADGPLRLILQGRSELRKLHPVLAIDFQGLVQSALIGRLAVPDEFWGFDQSVARERVASRFYTRAVSVAGPHRIERNLQLVQAAGARRLTSEAWLPEGEEEGELPLTPFVLASPFAGWEGKQWPLESYAELALLLQREGIPLVLNVSDEQAPRVAHLENVKVHNSSLSGLLFATRRASAVVGVDSGPLHAAAAIGKPGAAIYGPTDPAATGPYGGSMQVLRTTGAETTYDRHKEIQASMRAITAFKVFTALMHSLERQQTPAARP